MAHQPRLVIIHLQKLAVTPRLKRNQKAQAKAKANAGAAIVDTQG